MPYYAKIENEIVQTVIVADIDFIEAQDSFWVETFINSQEKKYAGIGDVWDGENFISPPSDFHTWNGSEWILNE